MRGAVADGVDMRQTGPAISIDDHAIARFRPRLTSGSMAGTIPMPTMTIVGGSNAPLSSLTPVTRSPPSMQDADAEHQRDAMRPVLAS